jgi:hypothetical protein
VEEDEDEDEEKDEEKERIGLGAFLVALLLVEASRAGHSSLSCSALQLRRLEMRFLMTAARRKE